MADKCCNCAEEMAEKLKQFENHFGIIFEGNKASIQGSIIEVIDDKILRMERVVKTLYTPSLGPAFFNAEILFISICDITQFIPLNPIPPTAG
ncbi:hypothetical protein QFZ28_002535 [Neobacillus niacini]|nr:hypothetical protein [Neobacillus niacini]